MKVLSLNRLKDSEQLLEETFPETEFVFRKNVDEISEEDKKDADIVIGYSGKADQAFFEGMPNLKFIAWYAAGVNNLPLEYLAERDVLLTNASGIHAKQMSQFAFAYILDDYKQMRVSRHNQDNKVYDSKVTGRRLDGDTILILGTGNIPKEIAKLANAFEMKVIGINTTGHEVDGFDETYPLNALNEVLPKADIIINVLPETEDTYHLLKSEQFDAMKESALFINIGRGTIASEETIINALKEDKIRHAYLDVFEKEPLSEDSPLYELDNVSITAHITGNGKENFNEASQIFIRNFKHFLNNGDVVENKVDLSKGY
ncbi:MULTISPECIES: phosphoglycerate dehydrogenase [Staphylococcus]|uniref:phosphoglycerate dehydrogenase n=1 Tax=Staphylococcus TaxID=1279 RepID=UPI0021CE14EB|nr:phosphoglycerate dehydrogenase [Staphylococcus sp. IVB6181]UXV35928.1 phosphoglycerate dehydrogenase [Staphylococcus sp. IVB6181]